jgi:type IV pilus assembly protein PilF
MVLAVLMAACSGSPTYKEEDNSSGRQAAEINTSLGREYLSRGQFEISLDKLKKAINSDPDYAPAHTVIAVLYERIGEDELAEKHYQEAVKILPDNGDVNNNYGVFLCQKGKAASAEPYFLIATKDPFYRTPQVALSNAGSCELQQGNLDKAERYLRQSLEYDAEFADALLAMADVSFRKRDNFRARAFLQRFESQEIGTAVSLYLGYQIESGLQNEQSVQKYLDQLLSKYPESEQAGKIRGELQ